MWRIGGCAALRSSALARAVRSTHARHSVISTHGSFSFTTASRQHDVLVGGVALQEVAHRSWEELQHKFGVQQMRTVRQNLPTTWTTLTSPGKNKESEAVIAPMTVKQFFSVAHKCNLPKLMLETFEYFDKHFPALGVDYLMYGQMFTLLRRIGQRDQIGAIYARTRPRFTDPNRPPPEIVYRYGIYAKLGHQDFAGVDTLVNEMQHLGVPISNEIVSYMMVASAKAGDKARVLELFASLNPQEGQWHTADVDRVITSMGKIRCPDEAFEFYRHSQIKLSSNTLVALLQVCKDNDRLQQARAILANRKRFNLVLKTREYNRAMEVMEHFQQGQVIAELLDEMTEQNIKFDKYSLAIIERNQQHLQGTAYAIADEKTQPKTMTDERTDQRTIRTLLANKEYAEAAAIVDSYVRLVTESDIDRDSSTNVQRGATILPAVLANDAISVYIAKKDHHKVKALLHGFRCVKGGFDDVLARIIAFYSKKGDDSIVYDAFKALQFQGRDIFRVREAMERFQQFHDPEAAMLLFYQAFRHIAQVMEETRSDGSNLKEVLPFHRVNVIKMTQQILVENYHLGDVLKVFDHMELHDFEVSAADYATVFRIMRNQLKTSIRTNGGVGGSEGYTLGDFEMIWDDMVRRDVVATKQILGQVCAVFAEGKKDYQLQLLTAYNQARDNTKDNYILPPMCYKALLAMAAEHSSMDGLYAIYHDAIDSLPKKDDSKKKVPRDWVTMLMVRLADENEAERTFELLMAMPALCGGYSYDGIVAALRVCGQMNDLEKLEQLVMLFKARSFRLNLQDAETLMQIAKASKSCKFAGDIIHLFEMGNLVQKDSISHGSEQGMIPTDAAVDKFPMQRQPNARVVAKLQNLYDVAATLSEQDGENSESAALFVGRLRALKALEEKLKNKHESATEANAI